MLAQIEKKLSRHTVVYKIFLFIFFFYSLLIGILFSLIGVYVKGCKPYSSLLGTTSGSTGIYVDLKYHKSAVEVPKIKIFRYCGSINFATRSSFKKVLYQHLDVDHEKLRKASIIICDTPLLNSGNNSNNIESGTTTNVGINSENSRYRNHFYALIIDLSALGHIDYAGCKTLTEIIKDMELLNVNVYFANPSDTVYDSLVHSMALGESLFQILPSLHDAVLYAQANPPPIL